MPEFSRVLVWLRRDLRLRDHRALYEATRQGAEVVPVFVYDSMILDALEDRDDRRVSFIHDSLDLLDTELQSLGKGLITVIGDPVQEIPRLAQELGADALFASHDDEPYAIDRDAKVTEDLAGIAFRSLRDHVVFERQEVLNQSGEPFRVFSPYARAWRAKFEAGRDDASYDPDLSRLVNRAEIKSEHLGNRTFEEIGFQSNQCQFAPGEAGARVRLEGFREKMADYAIQRNIPSVDDTSGLSIHLRFGTISARECVRAALSISGNGAEKWMGELIWREFYHMILANFPHVAHGESFNRGFDRVEWQEEPGQFQAWCEGRTGYPLVDAAMRCFRETGWMHNRCRMVVASFLVKDLLIDWRKGERYFERFLLDFEFSSNNGNWQWAAGTGVDAQPYFRVFNPVLQSRKFDPDGLFIRQWCPELSDFDNRMIHEPWLTSDMEQLAAGCRIGEEYPAPIVDHATQKARAVAMLAAGRGD